MARWLATSQFKSEGETKLFRISIGPHMKINRDRNEIPKDPGGGLTFRMQKESSPSVVQILATPPSQG